MRRTASPPPWYRQFWPWFLIALPTSSVVAGITTVIIANHAPDGVVVGDYYKHGLAINQDLQRDRRAADLALRAQVSVTAVGALHIAMHGEEIDRLAALQVRLLHPTKAGRDQSVTVLRGRDGGFTAQLQRLEPAQWHIAIEPLDSTWRLQGRLQWPRSPQVIIRAGS